MIFLPYYKYGVCILKNDKQEAELQKEFLPQKIVEMIDRIHNIYSGKFLKNLELTRKLPIETL